MATEATEYWSDFCTVAGPPPDEWFRVVVDVMPKIESDDLSEDMQDWLKSDDALGRYCWHYYDYYDKKAPVTALIFSFDHRDTAFEFKLRFG